MSVRASTGVQLCPWLSFCLDMHTALRVPVRVCHERLPCLAVLRKTWGSPAHHLGKFCECFFMPCLYKMKLRMCAFSHLAIFVPPTFFSPCVLALAALLCVSLCRLYIFENAVGMTLGRQFPVSRGKGHLKSPILESRDHCSSHVSGNRHLLRHSGGLVKLAGLLGFQGTSNQEK